jgi:outer membrane receptor protein involved in Fe transport
MGTLGATWRTPVGTLRGQELTLSARADASYQSKMYVDPTNTSWAPARTLINASIGLEAANWSVRIWGRNLADREYVSYSFATFGASGAGSGVTYAPLLGDRRTLGATLALNY